MNNKDYWIAQGYKRLLSSFVKQLIKDYKNKLINRDELLIICRCLDIYGVAKVKPSKNKRFLDEKKADYMFDNDRIEQLI